MATSWARFDGMTWPVPGERLDEVEHTLRYGTPSRSDLLQAASVIAAYSQMLRDPRRHREHVVRNVREAME
jgi:hypothetical protein